MPFVQLETSVDLAAADRSDLLHAIIACTAEALTVPPETCRASYARTAATDGVIGTGTNEPWTIAYAHLKAGRSADRKHAFTDALFDLLAARLGVARSSLRILISDYAPEDWNNGGDVVTLR